MSAWLVSRSHIDCLIEAALEYGPPYDIRWEGESGEIEKSEMTGKTWSKLTYNTANEVGRMLWRENLKSINHRYPDTQESSDNIPGPVDFHPVEIETYTFVRHRTRTPTPVEALKQIDCYEYQACEHDEWEGSEAQRFCAALTARLITCLPGYDAAPWGWEG